MEGRKMKKVEFIAKYGEDGYERGLKLRKEWTLRNPEREKAKKRKNNPEYNRKGGKHYKKMLKDNRTGLRGERNKIRHRHKHRYAPFKKIIAPNSQIHHEWIPKTAEYRGVALVEMRPHQYGIIDVIQILDGEITLLTEEEVRNGLEEKKEKNKMTEKKENKGRYLQLHYYISDADEALILQAGVEVGRFLDICVEDAVERAKKNLGEE